MIGAASLFYAAQNLPRPGGEGEVFQHIVDAPDGLLSPSAIILIGAACLTLGLPSVFTLFPDRARSGVVGLALMALGAMTLAGFAHQLILLRSIVDLRPLSDGDLVALMADQMQGGLLVVAYLFFFVGELGVAWSLSNGCGVPRWIPLALVAHVVTGIAALPFDLGWLGQVPSVFMAAAFAGIGITANLRAQPSGFSSRDIAERHALER